MHRMSCCMFFPLKRSKIASDFIRPRPHAPSGQEIERSWPALTHLTFDSCFQHWPFPLAQEFLICIEMFVAALAHAYAFPPSDYTDPLHPPHGMVSTHAVFVEVSHKQNQTNT